MKKTMSILILSAMLLTGCSEKNTEKEITAAEITTEAETVAESLTTAETTSSESRPEITDGIVFNCYNEHEIDGVYVAGCSEALESYSYRLGGDKLSEWGKDIDFEKDAVVMKVIKGLSSSYKITFKSVDVVDGELFFDYASYCPEICNEDIVSYVIAAVFPKEKLSFLENDDDWGIKLEASYDSRDYLIQLKFLQWGEKDTRELLSGSWYEIERYDEEKGWCRVDYSDKFKDTEMCRTDEGWIISEDGHSVFIQDLSVYDKLPVGKYRIAKKVINLRRQGVYDEKIYYAEFEEIIHPVC